MKKVLFVFLLSLTMIHALTLSQAEKRLIEEHPLNCISTAKWSPFNFMENQKLIGMGIDYWHLIQRKLGMQGSCTITKSWTEVLNAIKNRSADITIATQATDERLAYAAFSKPYATYPIVIVTRNDIGFIDHLHLLREKTILVGKNYTTAAILQKNYPDLPFSQAESIDAALESVSKGEAFAAIGILPVISYKLHKDAFADLKISGSIPAHFSVSIMIRKDYEKLLPLINRAIDAISAEERNAISKKWITFREDRGVPPTYFYLLLISSAVLILFFSIWLYLLKREVKQKNTMTRQLQTLVTVDSLTSICNRYMFDITLDKEIELTKRHHYALSLIFFDIDGFKGINDRYGHKVGDTILKELARMVSQSIRKSDTFCRWGGDEFVIILHGTTEGAATKLAHNLDFLVRSHHFTHAIKVSCSFGVTGFRDGDTHESLMARLDALLYAAKGIR